MRAPDQGSSLRRAGRSTVVAATAVASLCLAAGAGAGGGGGVGTGALPKVTGVTCVTSCAGSHKATVGSKVAFSGSHLRGMRRASFDRAGGGQVETDVLDASRSSVKVVVPGEATSGRPRLEGRDGGDASPERLEIVGPDEIPDDGPFRLARSSATPKKAFYDARREAKLSYRFEGEATDVQILVAKKETDKVVRTIVQRDRQPGTEYTVRWNGRTDNGGTAASDKYRFKVGPKSGGGLDSDADAVFGFYTHKFPIRGPHSYGDGIGAGRGHQGQDVFARCGTPLEAARGGRVQWKRYHSAAGYYLVIDAKDTGRDYVYMHMRKKGRPREGSRVHTGERIGRVSDTGNASGCHLHFEIWSPPGWYEGGHFTNPTDDLRSWDRWS